MCSLYTCSQCRQTYDFWCFLFDQITSPLQLVTQTSTKWFVITTQPYRWQTLMSVCLSVSEKGYKFNVPFDVNYYCWWDLDENDIVGTEGREFRELRAEISCTIMYHSNFHSYTTSWVRRGPMCRQRHDMINCDGIEGSLGVFVAPR